jgi:acyl-CoA thioesterase-1
MTRLVAVAACFAAVLSSIAPVQAANEAPMTNQPIVIFAYGDSLTAGYGLPPTDAFPSKLQAKLREKGYNVTIVNGGVSGDTTQNGVARLDWSLPKNADAAIVEFGANDAFQGVDTDTVKSNLETIVQRLQTRGLDVMISGMMAPRNLGAAYYDAFDPIFADVARTYNCTLYPFFLDGVVANPALNQADYIHPNAAGVDIIVAKITPTVEMLIKRVIADRKRHSVHSTE